MNPFKVGDTVRRTAASSAIFTQVTTGSEWTVESTDGNYLSIQEFRNNGHQFFYKNFEKVNPMSLIVVDSSVGAQTIANALREAGIECKVSVSYSNLSGNRFGSTTWAYSVQKSEWVIRAL